MGAMTTRPFRLRQVLDWRAALIAGLIAGGAFLALQMILVRLALGGSPLLVLRWNAALLLGESILPATAPFTGRKAATGLAIHLGLAILFTFLLTFIIHRWGLLIGLVGGALFGGALYLVNFLTFAPLFPWFSALESTLMLGAHVAFGAIAGSAYELLEVESYVLVKEA